jgi:hypothetical protein
MTTPSSYFPSAFYPQLSYRRQTKGNVQVITSLSGIEQWRVNGARRRMFDLPIMPLQPSDRRALTSFMEARLNPTSGDVWFYFFCPDAEQVVAYSVGSVAGVSSLIIPSIESDVTAVYLDGVAESGWSITTGAGSGGEDRIDFAGSRTGAVTADMTARLRIQARFDPPDVIETFQPTGGEFDPAMPSVTILEVL